MACGTGLSFALLVEGVGTAGRVTGVELSPDMARYARERIARAGWANVTLIEADARNVALADRFDAVRFNFTHEVLQSFPRIRRARVNPRDCSSQATA